MYSRDYLDSDPYPAPYAELYDRPHGLHPSDRLTHVVLVDGRLVDLWSESVVGTRWEEYAERFDRERRPASPPPPAPPPTYERALTWLDDVCGSRAAVLALTVDALVEDGLDLPEVPTAAERDRLTSVAELLDALAERRFDSETSFAFRAALLRIWASEPEVVTDAASASRVAGGVAWAVGKANGLLRPQGDVRIGLLQDALALTTSPTTYGKVVERALVGYRDRSDRGYWRPDGLPELLALGHPDLLLGSVRRRLVRVRDRALEAQAAATAA